LQKLNKLTQRKETIGHHIPEGGALSPLAYIAKKDYSGDLLICNKFFILEFRPNYIDPSYIYTYGLHFKEGNWLQQNETRYQIHRSTTITNLINAMEVT
jgi:hypothetical protein